MYSIHITSTRASIGTREDSTSGAEVLKNSSAPKWNDATRRNATIGASVSTYRAHRVNARFKIDQFENVDGRLERFVEIGEICRGESLHNSTRTRSTTIITHHKNLRTSETRQEWRVLYS